MSALERACADLDRALPPGTYLRADEMEAERLRTGHSIYAWRAARARMGVRSRRLSSCWIAYRGPRRAPPDMVHAMSVSQPPPAAPPASAPAERAEIAAIVAEATAARSCAIGAAIREHWADALAVWAVAMALVVLWVYAA